MVLIKNVRFRACPRVEQPRLPDRERPNGIGRSTGPTPQRRRNTTLRLFDGMGMRSGAASPC